jgi:acetylornithine deacetylase
MDATETQELLKQLIAIPSFSKEEAGTADCIAAFLSKKGIPFHRKNNNVWAVKSAGNNAPVVLLNSHHDTVKPNSGYTNNPFEPIENDGKLYGLGSNDAGAALVCLLAAFINQYSNAELPYTLIYAATAEEEISGKNGIESILPELGKIDAAIVGEPTGMNPAIAEKGLLVLDCTAKGISGHAAREEGRNAIYEAMKDIEWFRFYKFPKISEVLGPVKMSVTQIHAGTQHNVIPESCNFTVDIRCTDAYTLEELLAVINDHVDCEITPRSTRIKPSSISIDHPLMKAITALELTPYGSPTTSDQALIPFPSIKMGPGDSARSHTADEYIYLHEIEEGIRLYTLFLNQLKFTP